METIRMYLENMFRNLPQTSEIRKAKEEMMNMMEDKYNELKAEGKTENEAVGVVISEFGNLEELAGELGISGYMNGANEKIEKERKCINSFQVKEYLQERAVAAPKIGLGVALCICSPVILLFLSGMAEMPNVAISESMAAIIGLIVLFFMVASAVALFIYYDVRLGKYEWMEKEGFVLEFSMEENLRKDKDNYTSTFGVRIAIGVILCILSVIPICVFAILFEKNELLICAGVCIVLFLIAIAVYIFIVSGMRHESYSILLQEGDYEVKRKESKLISIIASFYWPITTCIYLAWSFISMDWSFTWIVWPIAGTLFGAIASVCSVIENQKKERSL